MMKINQLLQETPLADFEIMGAEHGEASFRDSDLKAMTNPKWQKKVRNAFSRTPHNFNLYLYNYTDTKYNLARSGFAQSEDWFSIDYIGYRDKEFAQKLFGQLPQGFDDAINVVLFQNEGDGRVALTPWILAHRVAHAFFDDLGKRHLPMDMKKLHNEIWKRYRYLLEDVVEHMLPMLKTRGFMGLGSVHTSPQIVSEVASLIGTMKSAKQQNLAAPGEFFIELVTQYLVQGSITFNIPDVIVNDKKDQFRTDRLEGDLKIAMHDLNDLLRQFFESAVGKMFVL